MTLRRRLDRYYRQGVDDGRWRPLPDPGNFGRWERIAYDAGFTRGRQDAEWLPKGRSGLKSEWLNLIEFRHKDDES